MNFRQFRYVSEALSRHLNLTEVANALQASQSGVSKQILDFEGELGIPLFVRRGRRFVALTDAGTALVPMIHRVAEGVERLVEEAARYARDEGGRLVIATTHAHARYTLPSAIEQFRALHPHIEIAVRQAMPRQVAEWVAQGDADVGVATESLAAESRLNTLTFHSWRYVVAVRRGHPLASHPLPTLADIAAYPIITYDRDFTARQHIDRMFSRAGLDPEIVLTALDSDVIKAYVEIGLGVGILAEMAIDPARQDDKEFVVFTVPELSQSNTALIAVRSGASFREYVYQFVEMLLPDRDCVEVRRQMNVQEN
ncbi:LysR substrate-binding domain-containing protein [Robbsia sp. KACC 23696]|uniref:LysR substrate-binding domain-containing protein n=1 Tax=Robbsia sp. KACC 23696 TaxID=3149231 RepID=UPI00325B0A36